MLLSAAGKGNFRKKERAEARLKGFVGSALFVIDIAIEIEIDPDIDIDGKDYASPVARWR